MFVGVVDMRVYNILAIVLLTRHQIQQKDEYVLALCSSVMTSRVRTTWKPEASTVWPKGSPQGLRAKLE